MNEEEKEKKLLSLLAPRRSEAFWAAQRARIISAPVKQRGAARAWLLLPAAAALLVLVLSRGGQPPVLDNSPAVTTAFLEHLDLLDDMDILEAVSEDEL